MRSIERYYIEKIAGAAREKSAEVGIIDSDIRGFTKNQLKELIGAFGGKLYITRSQKFNRRHRDGYFVWSAEDSFEIHYFKSWSIDPLLVIKGLGFAFLTSKNRTVGKKYYLGLCPR